MVLDYGLVMIIIGIVLIIAGIVMLLRGIFVSSREGKAEAGAVIVIGPLPIIVGTSRRAAIWAGIIALIILAFIIALILLMAHGTAYPHGY